MKRCINYLKLFVFLLCTMGAHTTAKAQFLNGDFAAPGTAGCSGGTNWTTNAAPDYAQYVTSYNPDPWIDLTPCGTSGNGTWVEQTINTVPGELYFIRFDLGTWYYWGFDAGVDLDIDGTQLGSRIAHGDPAPMGAPGWKRMTSCIFRATGPTTIVRFTGNAQYIANPSNPVGIPGVIGLDNVELYKLNDYLAITDDETPCNNHCFGLLDTLSQDTLAHSIDNHKWYIQGVLEGTGPTFCYKFPQNSTSNVMLTFDVTDSCGTHADTLYTTINSGACPCDVASTVSINSIPVNCNSYHFDLSLLPGYTLDNAQWTVNGAPVSGGPSSLDIFNYGPGTYTICAIVTIHLDGEAETCTDTICTTITITYQTTLQPDVFIQVCGTGNASYTPACSYPYTSYTLTGSGSYSSSGPLPAPALSLPAGSYVLTCYDKVNCRISVTNIYVSNVPMVTTYCEMDMPNCSQLENTGPGSYIMNQLLQRCPDCATTLMNMTSKGAWEHVSHDPNTGMLILRREYISTNPCRKCIITFHIGGQVVTTINLPMSGQPCRTISNSNLPACLRNKPLKKYLAGHADQAVDVNPNVGIQLCCANPDGIPNPTYYLYDPANPCCIVRITLICSPLKQAPDGLGITETGNINEAPSLSIQPNPASSIFRIASGRGMRYEQVEILDISGRVLLSKKDVNEETRFDISNFSLGHYLVKVKTETGIVVLKLEHLKQ